MRKLILIAAITLMSTSSCYANLSLGSSGSSQPAIKQSKTQSTEALPAPIERSPENRSADNENTRHRERHLWAKARSFGLFWKPRARFSVSSFNRGGC
jgi:hypothetical protein